MDKYKNIIKKHKNALYVNVDKEKMMSLVKKEGNKPLKMPKPKGKWDPEKAVRVKCAHCSMCGGCGFRFEK